ncbi:hypothetical protein ACNKHL_24550 [Shigella flexneri]
MENSWYSRGLTDIVESKITVPVQCKMVINGTTTTKVFMAHFEDSLAPDWNKVIDGGNAARWLTNHQLYQ